MKRILLIVALMILSMTISNAKSIKKYKHLKIYTWDTTYIPLRLEHNIPRDGKVNPIVINNRHYYSIKDTVYTNQYNYSNNWELYPVGKVYLQEYLPSEMLIDSMVQFSKRLTFGDDYVHRPNKSFINSSPVTQYKQMAVIGIDYYDDNEYTINYREPAKDEIKICANPDWDYEYERDFLKIVVKEYVERNKPQYDYSKENNIWINSMQSVKQAVVKITKTK